MDLNERLNKYKIINNKNREKEDFYASTLSMVKSSNYVQDFIFLVENIPNWEQYFTNVQIKLIKLFINYRNVSDIANLVNKPYGSIYSAIFGSGTVNNEQGIFGKLKYIYARQEVKFTSDCDIGNAISKRLDEVDNIRNANGIKILETELLKYINNIPDWKDYVDKYHIKLVELFLIHKSTYKLKTITNTNAPNIFFGKSLLHPTGIYKTLKNEYLRRN